MRTIYAAIAFAVLAPQAALAQFKPTPTYYAPAFHGPGPVYLYTSQATPSPVVYAPAHVHASYGWPDCHSWGPTNHRPWYVYPTTTKPVVIEADDNVRIKPKTR